MKIRNGFVSNSSSSSYICEICGRSASGWDLSAGEAEMVTCQEGHLICSSHVQHDAFSKEVVIAYINNMLSLSDTEKTAIIGYLQAMDAETYAKCTDSALFVDEGNASIIENMFNGKWELYKTDIEECFPSEFCPICKLEVVLVDDALRYLCAANNVAKKDVDAEIRTKFTSCAEMRQWLMKTEKL
jgi:hypothetical protein